MKTSIKNLEDKGFVVLAYPPDLRQAVDTTVEFWKKFCELPLEIKRGLPYSNGGAGVGYEYKDGQGNKADRKENFDVTKAGQEWLRVNASKIENHVALEFIQHMTALVGLMKETILDFAKQSEQSFGLEGFTKEVDASESGFFIRFIHYFGDRKLEDETATSHVYQSGFTLHLFESAPGLQCLTHGDNGEANGSAQKWIDMPVSGGETVIIPAMQLQLRSRGKLRALCHRVVANEETARGGRYSAVCFVQLKHTSVYDKDRHGRLQEREPGFNYAMPYEEFVKLFRK